MTEAERIAAAAEAAVEAFNKFGVNDSPKLAIATVGALMGALAGATDDPEATLLDIFSIAKGLLARRVAPIAPLIITSEMVEILRKRSAFYRYTTSLSGRPA